MPSEIEIAGATDRDKLREIRESLGLSTRELSGLAGLREAAVRDFESGRSDLTLGAARKISAALTAEVAKREGASQIIDGTLNA